MKTKMMFYMLYNLGVLQVFDVNVNPVLLEMIKINYLGQIKVMRLHG
jgi:hypothetical protein